MGKNVLNERLVLANDNNSERDYVMDMMKGIGIILVVFGHVIQNVYIINSFHMPLFFVLAGAAVAYSKSKSSVTKRAKRLLFPYFIIILVHVLGVNRKADAPCSQRASFLGAIRGTSFCIARIHKHLFCSKWQKCVHL